MSDQSSDTMTPDALAAIDDVDDLLADCTSGAAGQDPPEFRLHISQDKVSVLLDCADPLAKLSENVLQILADFEKLEIPVFPNAEQLTVILQNICTPGLHLVETPLIMGQKAVPSQSGKLVWSKEYFNEGWAEDEESGAVDFWNRLENRAVTEDELLVTLYNPVPGESGLNVFGNEIPVSKPDKIKLRCGKCVRTQETEDGVQYFSEVNGRVRFNDGTVSVDDVYVIQGNVNLETGNIKHTGAVQIQGDVESGATIEADGDIMIKGMVDPCLIRCGGTLTVAGGLVGSEEYSIEVQGDLEARYVNEANITVAGDVTVTNEISHSQIKSLGKVMVPKGRVAGGCIQAYKGIRVAEAGASGSASTNLIAGVDYALEESLAASEAKIEKLEEAQKKIKTALESLGARKGQLEPSEQEVFTGLQQKSRQLGQAMADECVAVQKITQESQRGAVYEVVMFKEVWTGTRIQLGENFIVVKTSIEKPRIAQLRKTRVRVLPLGEGNTPTD